MGVVSSSCGVSKPADSPGVVWVVGVLHGCDGARKSVDGSDGGGEGGVYVACGVCDPAAKASVGFQKDRHSARVGW